MHGDIPILEDILHGWSWRISRAGGYDLFILTKATVLKSNKPIALVFRDNIDGHNFFGLVRTSIRSISNNMIVTIKSEGIRHFKIGQFKTYTDIRANTTHSLTHAFITVPPKLLVGLQWNSAYRFLLGIRRLLRNDLKICILVLDHLKDGFIKAYRFIYNTTVISNDLKWFPWLPKKTFNS